MKFPVKILVTLKPHESSCLIFWLVEKILPMLLCRNSQIKGTSIENIFKMGSQMAVVMAAL